MDWGKSANDIFKKTKITVSNFDITKLEGEGTETASFYITSKVFYVMNLYKELQWKGKTPLIYRSEEEGATTTPPLPADGERPSPIAPRTSMSLDAKSTALLVVDVQPEYWSSCPSVRRDFPDFPANICRTVVACRDRNVKVLWVRADYRYSHSPWLVQFCRLQQHRDEKFTDIMTEVPFDPTSKEFNWEPFAAPRAGEIVIPKTSWSSVSNTALLSHLRSLGVDTVLVCGLITSVCVQHSAFGVFEAGYRTMLVTDACADRGRFRHDAALALYGDYMYELVTSGDLESRLRHQTTPSEVRVDKHTEEKEMEKEDSIFPAWDVNSLLRLGSIHKKRDIIASSQLVPFENMKENAACPAVYLVNNGMGQYYLYEGNHHLMVKKRRTRNCNGDILC